MFYCNNHNVSKGRVSLLLSLTCKTAQITRNAQHHMTLYQKWINTCLSTFDCINYNHTHTHTHTHLHSRV